MVYRFRHCTSERGLAVRIISSILKTCYLIFLKPPSDTLLCYFKNIPPSADTIIPTSLTYYWCVGYFIRTPLVVHHHSSIAKNYLLYWQKELAVLRSIRNARVSSTADESIEQGTRILMDVPRTEAESVAPKGLAGCRMKYRNNPEAKSIPNPGLNQTCPNKKEYYYFIGAETNLSSDREHLNPYGCTMAQDSRWLKVRKGSPSQQWRPFSCILRPTPYTQYPEISEKFINHCNPREPQRGKTPLIAISQGRSIFIFYL